MCDTIAPVRVQMILDIDVVRLSLWTIKFAATGIKVEGFVTNKEGNMMQKVCSENILRRITSTLLFDNSGEIYELSGKINRKCQVRNGMPTRVVEEFVNGFPENWTFLINTCLTTEHRSALGPIQAAKETIMTLADKSGLHRLTRGMTPRTPQQANSTSAASANRSNRCSLFDEMDALFDAAKIEKTPVMDFRRNPRTRQRELTPPDERGPCSSQQAYERDYYRDSYWQHRYEDDRSRIVRKRGYYRSPENRDQRSSDGYRYDSKRWRPRESCSSSGRSNRHRNPKDQKIVRREKEFGVKLRAARRHLFSEDSENSASIDLGSKDTEDFEIFDDFDDSGRSTVVEGMSEEETDQKPPRGTAPRDIRSMKACPTAATPVQKQVTWLQRELDKLRHVNELKKPTGNLEDWLEVTRLLKKNGVEAVDVKLAAETRLGWKEPKALNAD